MTSQLKTEKNIMFNRPIIKIKPKRIDLGMRLRGITTEFVGFIPQSLVLRSIVLGLILYIVIGLLS